MLKAVANSLWSSLVDAFSQLFSLPSPYVIVKRDFIRSLRVSEFQFRDTVENAVEGIIRTSREGKFIYVNPAYAQMLGYDSPNELLNKIQDVSVEVYVSPEVRQDFLMRLNRDKQAKCEYEAWKKDGSKTWINVSSRVVEDEQGNFLHYESIAEDVSERKRKQNELNEMAKSLERSNAELERFAHVVAHDVNEPLRTITNFGKLLLKDNTDNLGEESKRYIDFMIDASQRMRVLVDDILTFSQVGFQPTETEFVDMNEVVAGVVLSLQITIRETKANLKIEKLPTVIAHKAKMQRLMQNLLSNALKFRRDVPLEISVQATPWGNQSIIEVRDNGIGFDEKYSGKIFEFFVRLVSRGEYPGSGMGLAMCKRIVELYGGHIWAKSKFGEGTSIFFSMPLAEASQASFQKDG